MVGSSKILTVSYGTFSCTLEGFDDSFSTMKAIAEYFRDLAADDRYFGAEPPSPDADMLARIAEREVARRVEARTGASGIVLRATGALEAPAPRRPESRADDDERAGGARPTATSERQAMPPQPDPVGAAPEGDAGRTRLEADSVAAKLQRIRAVVGRSAAPTDVIYDGEEEDPLTAGAEPAGASESPDEAPVEQDDLGSVDATHGKDEVQEDDADVPDRSETPERTPEYADESGTHTLDGGTETALESAADAGDEAEPFREATASEHEDVAGDDEASDAEVAAATAVPENEAWAEFEQIAPAEVDETSTAPADAEAVDAHAPAEDAPVLVEAHVDVAADEAADEPANSAREETADGDAVVTAGTTSAAGDDELERNDEPVETGDRTDSTPLDLGAYLAVDKVGDETADLLADLLHHDGEAEPDTETAALEAAWVEDSSLQDDFAADQEPEEDREWPEAAAQVDAAAGRASAGPRMIRMSRSEYEARLVETVEADADASADETREAVDDAPSSPEAEANLMAEFAALEAGDEDHDDEEAEAEAFWDQAVLADQPDHSEEPATSSDVEQDAKEETGEDAPLRRVGHAFAEPEADEESLARLMSRAEGELAAPEAQSRREAITGLKAAVAAAEAARQLGEGRGAADEEAFRDDLRQVVRPRRPEPTEARSERPRPAPLKLVAAQRVDVAVQADEARQPVRPRRVTADETGSDTGAGQPGPESSAFASFAREVGAQDLSDMLEAAAAYTAFVEGLEDFSRPQLVNKVREVAPDTFSREDELRSFGTLLRQGRIAKVRNGRFQITETTRFHPERRAG